MVNPNRSFRPPRGAHSKKGVAVGSELTGSATEIEVKERKDRVDDAMHATRAAVEEGVVPGGGVALLYGTRVPAKLPPGNND